MKVLGYVFLTIIIICLLIWGGIFLKTHTAQIPEGNINTFKKSQDGSPFHYSALNEAGQLRNTTQDIFPQGGDYNGSYWLFPSAGKLYNGGPGDASQIERSFTLVRYGTDGLKNIGTFRPPNFGSHTMAVRHGDHDTWLLYGDDPGVGYIFDAKNASILKDMRPHLRESHILDAIWYQGAWIALLAPENMVVSISFDGLITDIGTIQGGNMILSDGNQLYFVSSSERGSGELVFASSLRWSYKDGKLIQETFFPDSDSLRQGIIYDGKDILHTQDSKDGFSSTLYKVVDSSIVKIGKLPGVVLSARCNISEQLCSFEFMSLSSQTIHYIFDAVSGIFYKEEESPFVYPSRFNIHETILQLMRKGERPNLICEKSTCIYWDSWVDYSSPRAYYLY